ncbi:hypothetical protein R50072_29940 [Simiduia litorea]|uniref:TonB family protein n=1 Tax=Simiduia litorea TaxID=1435348 RepID=UPI0036F3F7F5
MRVVFLSVLIYFFAGCSSQYYVASKERYHEPPENFDFENHEYFRTYTPKTLYPKYLCDSGFEGYAVVEFDIDSSGNTKNHRLVESDAKAQFEQVAILNATGIKYQPRTINGNPLEVTGVRIRAEFCVETCRGADNMCEHVSKECK